jgi:hypothetical protein
MKKPTTVLLCLLILLIALLVASPAARAALNAFDLDWWTMDSGGGTSTGGVYSLSGTIGQPDAGGMSGGSYTLAGGFWSGKVSLPPKRMTYLPLVTR